MIDPILLFDDNFWGSDTDFSNADSEGRVGHSLLAEGMQPSNILAGKSYIIPSVSDVYMHAARI